MCHRVVAEKVCEDCGCKMGEAVIAFDACSRKCTTPTYRLSPDPLELVCGQCTAAWSPLLSGSSSTPVDEPDHGIFPSPFYHKRRQSSSSSSASTVSSAGMSPILAKRDIVAPPPPPRER